ncbi:MAG: pilus assembly PilX N-terminal domain-containing protein [Gammaproteobacteria bacterium]|nr:pilus assembly PilX N-terminal domain-containing protein [Gammaproteobacteria bacterium]
MLIMTPQSAHKQQGIVLVVALLILMVMTVIGTSMLSTSTLEERMSSNVQQKASTFQAADSCVNISLADNNLVALATNNPGTAYTQICTATFGFTTTATMVYSNNDRPCPGSSSGTFVCAEVQATGFAQIANVSSKTTTIQTVLRLKPGTS